MNYKDIKAGLKIDHIIIEKFGPSLRTGYWEKLRKTVYIKCECGNRKRLLIDNLLGLKYKSCGCKTLKMKHGMGKTRFYRIFKAMEQRCNKSYLPSYKDYGGRGIKVLWKTFDDFKKDMYQNYLIHIEKFGEKETTIDRINVNGNYCKSNCRWATWKEQANNKR